jgi:hypothetical protein
MDVSIIDMLRPIPLQQQTMLKDVTSEFTLAITWYIPPSRNLCFILKSPFVAFTDDISLSGNRVS